ncbi:superfamily II DNA or RNA helicase [Catenuloplanes nepalensis]|uniref:Superfamily II DNA or RNA helicase n=1 Tax=Catenuloplanes nepalensis TaxID=587533 RepID=A0ABT9N7I3_9ACTN|nr:DEAD/DEAH box helicase [Catenuloplanes nepalensis]MDP9799662.1 superfamily II DNA or RNA helicase [Catenuloplanes nepalensis]
MVERAEARQVLAAGRRLRDAAERVADGDRHIRGEARDAYLRERDQLLARHLETLPVSALRDAGGTKIRTGPLEKAGLTTIGAVRSRSEAELAQIPGLSAGSARQLKAVAEQVAEAAARSLAVRVNFDTKDRAATALLTATHRVLRAEPAVGPARGPARRLVDELESALRSASAAGSLLRMLFAGRARKERAGAAVDQLRRLVEDAEREKLPAKLAKAERAIRERPATPRTVWKDFEKRSAEYYTAFGDLGAEQPDVDSSQGFLPTDITGRVRRQELDDTFRTVTLRGYQSFGARFALAQGRVIIGDEMGLGKTVQSIAAMAHLRARGETHFLVVCPASVMVNWTREVADRSKLTACLLHGGQRGANLRTWMEDGGVAVSTVDSLHTLEVPEQTRVGLMVVDEAHYVKNPDTRRSRAVREWTDRVPRVIFLSGTPMENKLDEFRNLIGYLQPRVSDGLDLAETAAGPVAFRRAVAPVYLRRNQEDVLKELPELVRAEEWSEFNRAEFSAYREAVAAGNFMAMRQVAFTADPGGSGKMQRLRELVIEARENGRKVVIFSNFRSVLTEVIELLGPGAFGPLTGSTPVEERQKLVDAFSAVPGHSVLISQIQAGGTGLNIQAASVVILCEPQIKPTIEDQAVARAHRMGQVRSVQVHRLLTENGPDQRILEILQQKRHLFDEYARHSEVARSSPDAVDVDLAKSVIAEEQRRLAV